MINFAVINLKNLIKNFIKLTFVICLAIGVMNIGDILIQKSKAINYADLLKNNFSISTSNIQDNFFKKIIVSELPEFASNITNTSGNSDEENNSQIDENTLSEETPIENQENLNTQNTQENTSDNNLKNISTSVISENNLSENYNTTYGSVKIKNETSCNLTNNILTPNVTYSDKSNILIFHTHTCESYTPTDAFLYTHNGNFRTTDRAFSVARVGDELQKNLEQYGISVIHDTTYHDYPNYTGSYGRSMQTVESILKGNADIDIVFDLHRDAIGDTSYAPKVKIGEEMAAQVMFVMGSDGGGLEHPNWMKNLTFAMQVQEKANEIYPGLMKPIILRNSRYNQNLTKGACIIEVGATGNTMEECLVSMKYFSKILSMLKKD